MTDDRSDDETLTQFKNSFFNGSRSNLSSAASWAANTASSSADRGTLPTGSVANMSTRPLPYETDES